MAAHRLRSVLAVLSLALVAFGCGRDSMPTEPEPTPLLGGLVGGVVGGVEKLLPVKLLACSPLPYAADTLVVDSQGGTLRAGPHALRIPAGAIAPGRRETIVMETLSDGVNTVRFQPHGLQFRKQAQLTLSYRNCPLGAKLLRKSVVYTSERLSILELIPSVDDLLSQTVTGRIDHFSRYGIAY
jgi:hypothetical protein